MLYRFRLQYDGSVGLDERPCASLADAVLYSRKLRETYPAIERVDIYSYKNCEAKFVGRGA